MANPAEIINLEKAIIDANVEIAKSRFKKRLSILWLSLGNSLILTSVILGNILIDFSKPGVGQDVLNFFGPVLLIISAVASSVTWYKFRQHHLNDIAALRKLESEKSILVESGERAISAAFMAYRKDVPTLIEGYRRSADRYRRRHNRFQLTVIVGSILTSVTTTAATENPSWSWIAVGISATVSISAGIISYFKFREKSMNLQQTADSIDQENQAFTLGIRRYKGLNPNRASAEFAEVVEMLREEQRKKDLQLEQPPEATQNAKGSGK
ncbi:DUF4231 domain-containing protein [Streptomyces carpaticus]|uniref:DUF4231 domain-containing protein n=1 Tax=Streptomyces carpaticus TaxID=285558 RepID=UPI0031F9F898